MKKLLLSLLLLVGAVSVHATKVYADLTNATAIGNASWDKDSKLFTWTAGSWAYLGVTDIAGNLSEYTSLVVETSDLSEGEGVSYRVDFELTNGDVIHHIDGAMFYSAGTKVINLAAALGENISSVKTIRVNTNSAGGSVTINKMYLVKPLALNFNDAGEATIDFTDFVFDSNLTVDESAKTITSEGQGSFWIALPTEGIDMSNVTNITLNREGDDIVQTMTIEDAENGVLGTFWSSKYGLDYTRDTGDGKTYAQKSGNVIRIQWNCATAGTMTLNGFTVRANTIVASTPGEVALNTFKYYNFPDGSDAWLTYNIGTETDTYMGSGSSDANHYMDLTGYEALRIYRDTQIGFRAFFINAGGTGTNNINDGSACVSWKDGYWEIDLTQVEKYDGKIYLNTIKSSAWGVKNVVKKLVVYNPSDCDYTLAGSGTLAVSAIEALADAKASLYDATGVTGAAEFNAANPNAVILANDPAVTGTNVIIDGTCADFAIVDNKPYKYAESFTAASAKQTVTMSAAGFSTTVVPFDAAVPSGLKAYNLVAISGNNITGEEVTSVKAGHPVLLEGAAGTYTFEASDVNVAGSADAVQNGLLTASYAGTEATNGGYVLQSQDGKVAFFTFEGTRTMKPFRAYIPANVNSAAKSLNIVLDESTGITAHNDSNATAIIRYNAAGQKLAGEQKGLNIVKMSNGEVKKVFVK